MRIDKGYNQTISYDIRTDRRRTVRKQKDSGFAYGQKKKKKKTSRICSREPAGVSDKVMTSRVLGTVIFSEVYHKGACRPPSRVKKEIEP
ncbi:hypothetical protein EVAR_76194_1 [Eumeta japonica]|uniref:Uncharacterized protein n=1 Tax=Eumeta variegata TaxID=151549 RepID=A0A4C1UWJ6_EUMVA|nr:hypothetical protein EVAR_76194_1 [Eumeta japonica]